MGDRPMEAEMPGPLSDVSDAIRAQVTRRLRGAPLYPSTNEDTALDDEVPAPYRSRQQLKSGKIRTTDTYVTKQVGWPHEMVVTNQGQPPIYQEMSIALFVNGYLAVVAV